MVLNHPLQNLLEPVVEKLGYELVRVLTIGTKNPTLQVMIDTKNEKEITVDDCALVSRALSEILDEKDPIENQYSLEVSSPGIDRPLTKLQHFQRFLGYEIKAEALVPVENRKRFKGVISKVENNDVFLDMDEHIYVLPFDNITKAKIVVTDDLLKKYENSQIIDEL